MARKNEWDQQRRRIAFHAAIKRSIVDGGMDAWISQGLSVVRKKRFWNFAPTLLKQ